MTSAARATSLLQLRTLAHDLTAHSIGLPVVGFGRRVINVWIGTVTQSLRRHESSPSDSSPTNSFDKGASWDLEKIRKIGNFRLQLSASPTLQFSPMHVAHRNQGEDQPCTPAMGRLQATKMAQRIPPLREPPSGGAVQPLHFEQRFRKLISRETG